MISILHGDCIEVMREMDSESVDAVVCDPPYGLEFMGKGWDSLGGNPSGMSEATRSKQRDSGEWWSGSYGLSGVSVRTTPEQQSAMQEWHREWAEQAYRVLRSGRYCVAFSATRTYHRLACALEDVGFSVEGCAQWLYGSGFPKSLNVGKAIDKGKGLLGTEGSAFTVAGRTDRNYPNPNVRDYVQPELVSPEARTWQGWGTALKPAWEPIVIGRKP